MGRAGVQREMGRAGREVGGDGEGWRGGRGRGLKERSEGDGEHQREGGRWCGIDGRREMVGLSRKR